MSCNILRTSRITLSCCFSQSSAISREDMVNDALTAPASIGIIASFHRPHPEKEAKRYQVRDAREFLIQIGVKP